MTESSLPAKLSILPVRASAEGQVTSATEQHCLLIRGRLETFLVQPGCLLTPKDVRVSSWQRCELEPQGSAVKDGPPHACAASDRPSRLNVASLAADPSRLRLLEGLSNEERNAILGAASYRRLSRHTVVTNQEEPATHLFLLLRGSARYFFIAPGGQKIYLLWLAPGDIFGGATLLPEPSLFLVGTEIVKDSYVLVWQRNIIRTLAARYPRLVENGLAIATDYLTWYLASHLSLVCHTARQRLAHVLVSLASGIGKKRPQGVDLEITNEQLANTANITLFTASRLMSEWQRSGALAKTRGRVLLRHPEQLLSS
jgi:CRP-like cAMP-binding protein